MNHHPGTPIESTGWLFAKHAAQLGVVAAVVWLVLHGGSSPVASLAYAAGSLTFLVTVALVDRQRFVDAEPANVGIVDVVAGVHAPQVLQAYPAYVPHVAAPVPNPGLAPLVDEMAALLAHPVDVT